MRLLPPLEAVAYAAAAALSVCLLFGSCADPASTSVAFEPPALLERSEGIRHGTEWDRVQNMYGTAAAALRANPDDVQAHLDLARLSIFEARVSGEHGHYYPAAADLLNRALAFPDLTPDQRYQALTMLASVQLSQHEFAEALRTSQRATKLNPYSATGYGALVDAHVELGQYEEAIAAADQMVKVKPDLRSYSRVSYLRELHGDIPGALEAMRLALDAGAPGTEENAWVRLTLGNLLHLHGRSAEARDQYGLALEERPGYPFALAALAELDAAAGDFATAERRLGEATEAIPEVGFYEQLAHIYRATGRADLAEKTSREVLEMFADDVAHGHNMNLEYADAHVHLTGDLDEALRYAELERDKRPRNTEVARRLAGIHYLRGEYDDARDWLTEARRLGSVHPELDVVDGLLQVAAGQREAGLARIEATASQTAPLAPAFAQEVARLRDS